MFGPRITARTRPRPIYPAARRQRQRWARRDVGGARGCWPSDAAAARHAESAAAAVFETEGQAFITDPSNSNPRFGRARLRAENSGATCSALDDAATQARSCGTERIHRERDLDALSARAVSLHPAGFAMLEPEPIRTAPTECAERLLGRVAATIGSARYPLRRDRVHGCWLGSPAAARARWVAADSALAQPYSGVARNGGRRRPGQGRAGRHEPVGSAVRGCIAAGGGATGDHRVFRGATNSDVRSLSTRPIAGACSPGLAGGLE